MRYLYSTEYYSAVERSVRESLVVMWINLEPVISRKSERESKFLCMLMHIYMESRKMVRMNLFAGKNKC